jgi:hypothetical protein
MTSLLAFCGASFAATVVLRDGTVIHGEIRSLQDDVYTVESDSVGTIHVRKPEVRSIDEGGESSGASVESSAHRYSPGAGELDATTSRITQDPKLLATVLTLQNDPDVLAVLADPEIMEAMTAGDYAVLLNNPKIVALMHNAKIREIIDGVR